MLLQLFRDGELVDIPPFPAGVHFYYGAGKVGIRATDGWSFEQTIFAETDGPAPADVEPEVAETILWTVAAIEEEEQETALPSPEQLRARMPKLSPAQFRLMLLDVLEVEPEGEDDDLYGILERRIDAIIDGISDPMLRAQVKIPWKTAQFFERSNWRIDLIGAALGLTPDDIDTAWTNALS